MYWNGLDSGHATAAVTALSTTWRFAEGFTGAGFNTFFLVGNPDPATAAQIRATFFLEAGAPIVQLYTIAPSSRFDLWANQVPGLQDAAFSTLIESQNGIPTVAERAMYWNGFAGGHVTTGLPAAATKWGFAEGLEHGLYGTFFRTFYLLNNATATAAQIRATFYREDGAGIVRTFAIGPNARFTLPAGLYPELSNQRFAAFSESTNSVAITAERAAYWDDSFHGGHASPGTPWPTGTIAPPPAPPAATTTTISPTSGPDTGGTSVTITGANYSAGATVSIGGTAATSVVVPNATTITATTGAGPTGAADVVVTSNGASSTLAGGFTYLTSAPPPPTPPPPSVSVAQAMAIALSTSPGPDPFNAAPFRDRVLANIGDPLWGQHMRPNGRISADVVAYNVPAQGQPYQIFDMVTASTGPNPAPGWLDITHTLEAGSTFVRVN